MPEQKSSALGWAQVGATAFLGVVGLVFTLVTDRQQEQNRKTTMAVELLSQREQAETRFRTDIFQTLLDRLLTADTPAPDRLAVLRLFQDNFHDIFNGRALFDVLEQDSAEILNPGERQDFLDDLTGVAREIGRTQETLIESLAQRRFETVEMVECDTARVKLENCTTKTVKLGLEHERERAENEGGHQIKIKLLKVRKDRASVFVEIDSVSPPDTVRFTVEYFDTPFTDNRLLPDGHRVALVLKDANISVHPHRAMFKVLEFPASYILSGYRPSVEQVDRLLGEVERKGGIGSGHP